MRRFGLWLIAAGVWAGGAARGQEAAPADGRELLGMLVSDAPANPDSANLFWAVAPDPARAAAAGGVVSLGAHPLTAGWAQLVLGRRPAAEDSGLPVTVGMAGGQVSIGGGRPAGGAGGGPAPPPGGGSGGGGGGGGGGGRGGGSSAARADGLPLLAAATPALVDAAAASAMPAAVASLTAPDGGAGSTPDAGAGAPGSDGGLVNGGGTGPVAGGADLPTTEVAPGSPPGGLVGTPEPGTLLLAAVGVAAVLGRRRWAHPGR